MSKTQFDKRIIFSDSSTLNVAFLIETHFVAVKRQTIFSQHPNPKLGTIN
jgi:hypothetical protein